jgi:hypothetical protein
MSWSEQLTKKVLLFQAQAPAFIGAVVRVQHLG